MSRENVELVRTLIPPAETDIASLLRDDSLFEQTRAAVEPLVDPDVKSVAMWQPGAERTYVGIDGFRKLWLDWLEPWATYQVGVTELIDSGDRVIALIHDRARRHDVAGEVEISAGSVWTIRDGRVVSVEFRSREEALEAAGLSE
jgi:ketosteroid isomerase-like protein